MNKMLIQYKTYEGFSLVELLIVIAIISILASIGYPSYTSFVVSGKRSAAQADLLGFASSMERHRAANYTYKGAASGGSDTGAPLIYATYSPSDGTEANKDYNLTIETVTSDGSSYTIRATPVSGSSQASDGSLYYYSDGRKAWDKNQDGTVASSEYCWSC